MMISDGNPEAQGVFKEDLLKNFHSQENLLEGAIEQTVITLRQRIAEIEESIVKTLAVFQEESNGEEDFMFKEGLYIFNEYRHLHNEQGGYKDELLALNEVRIIYLFKNIEISLKNLIKTAYPKANVKDLFKWDNMINFFKQKEINVQSIDGFEEVDQLRKVNNSIKHSNDFVGEVTKIPEFDKTDVDINEQIESFLDRILPKAVIFQNELIKEVKKELYAFDDSRLDRMATELYQRMKKEDAESFITILKSKYVE